MIRNDKDRAKVRRQLLCWQFLKRRMHSLARKFDLDVEELGQAYDEHIELLAEELSSYELRRLQALDATNQSNTFALLQMIEQLPTRLIEARMSLGLSQTALGQRVNINPQLISRYEMSEYATTGLGIVTTISQALTEIRAERELLFAAEEAESPDQTEPCPTQSDEI